jgi:hypothetical protein
MSRAYILIRKNHREELYRAINSEFSWASTLK